MADQKNIENLPYNILAGSQTSMRMVTPANDLRKPTADSGTIAEFLESDHDVIKEMKAQERNFLFSKTMKSKNILSFGFVSYMRLYFYNCC